MKQEIRYRDIAIQTQYVKLMAANVINRFGDSLDMIAFSLMVYSITGSAAWVALVFGFNALPTILLQPFAGAIVEGLNKKYTMVICDLGRGLVVSVTALLLILDLLSPWSLLLLTFLNSSFEALRIPAGIGIIPKILKKDYYAHGMSLNSTIGRVVEIVGLAAAGGIIGLFGIGTAIFIDALTFLASALIISFIRIPAEKRKAIEMNTKSYFHTLSEGFAYLKNAKIIFAICLLAGIINLSLLPVNSMQAPFITGTLGLPSIGLSVQGIASTAGIGIGTILFPFIQKRITNRILFIVGGIMIGICYLLWVLLAYHHELLWLTYTCLALSSFLFGFFASFIMSVINISFMQHIEEAYISRVGAIFNAIASSMTPLGSLLVAGLSLFLTVNQLFIYTGIFTIILFASMLSIKVLKQL
ncbi:MFS transporter [Paenibacillus sp. 1001270B_150601_E10]|uniref:MFS transporter n=1 Tax=Paenibacillus sp. 1001270B_150601_E10 TaxID=2787079 RepID=UPI001E31B1DD|nr:MFS transporter [Paenibacillus sp. 1001270B_150601_E10]